MSTLSRTPCDVPFGGRKRTLRRIRSMSALPLKADIVSRICHVRFVPKPDQVRRNKEYHYSITSSAVASNLSGMVSPRNRRPCPRDKDNSDRGRAHTEDRIGPQIDQFFCQRPTYPHQRRSSEVRSGDYCFPSIPTSRAQPGTPRAKTARLNRSPHRP